MPIRRIEGATPAPVINVNGKDVTLWNHGTIADGINLTVKTLRPICEAINEGYDDLSAAIDAEKLRAIQAETDLSGWCDSLSSKLDTVSSNLDIVSGDLIDEIERSTTTDNELQEQIDTLKAATDVIMVYKTYSDFSTKSGSLILTDADVIKVLNDEERQENQTYYQYSTATSAWTFIGELDPYYSKSDLENAAGKNINITTANGLKINTNDDVNFDSVSASTAYGSSAKFTNISATNISATNISANLFKSEFGTVDTFNLKFDIAHGASLTATEANVLGLTAGTLYGQSYNSNVDSLIGSAEYGQFAYDVINSAKFSAIDSTTSTAYLSGGFAIKAGDNLTLTYADKTFTLNAGDTGITAISAGNTKYTGPVFSASAGTGINFVNDSNNVLGIKASNSLITSATGGSAAYNLLTGQSATLYPGPGIQFYSADTNKLGIKVSAAGINGTITSIAGSALSAGANYTDGRYIYIDNNSNSINLSSNIIIDYMSANSALLSAIYDNGHYYNYLTPSSTKFTFGPGSTIISLSGVEVSDGYSNPKNISWTKLLDDFVLTTGNASGSKLSANTAITLVVTSQLPSILDANTYYIV